MDKNQRVERKGNASAEGEYRPTADGGPALATRPGYGTADEQDNSRIDEGLNAFLGHAN